MKLGFVLSVLALEKSSPEEQEAVLRLLVLLSAGNYVLPFCKEGLAYLKSLFLLSVDPPFYISELLHARGASGGLIRGLRK